MLMIISKPRADEVSNREFELMELDLGSSMELAIWSMVNIGLWPGG